MSSSARLLKIAARIDQVLMQELDQGIDLARLIQEPRYARDVLLVCDACRGTELPLLAGEFRRLLAEGPSASQRGGHARQRTEWSNTSTGFGVTGFGTSGPPDSLPANDTTVPAVLSSDEPPPGPPRQRWWTRWLKP